MSAASSAAAVHTAIRAARFGSRAVIMAASEPKKQQASTAWPLGKLYEEGSGVSKNGAGRTR
jgi:hypothetical protein